MNSQKNTAIYVYSILLSFTIFYLSGCQILKLSNGFNKIENTVNQKLLKFNDVSSKCLINFKTKNENINLIADFVCFNDSLIYLNFKLPLGISAAKLLFNEDSTFFKNELNKQNMKFSTNEFFKKYYLPINYKMIQDLILSQIFAYPDTNVFKNYKIINDSILHLNYIKKNTTYPYYTAIKHNINIKNSLVKDFTIEDYNTFTFINCQYEYQTINNKYFPKVLYLQIIQKDSVYIKIKFKNVKINTKPDFTF